MYSDLESDQRKREEVISSLYWSLMQNWNIPQSVQDYYGFAEDYRLFHQLEEMDYNEYKQKRGNHSGNIRACCGKGACGGFNEHDC